MNDSQLAASVLALLDGTADTFLVCAGAGAVVSQKTAAQAKTLLALVKADVGLGNVDNTADASKPVSTAQQTAIDLKIGGSVGSTDNQLVRSDGAGGSTVQATGITVDDSNNVTGVAAITASGAVTVPAGSSSSPGLVISQPSGSTVNGFFSHSPPSVSLAINSVPIIQFNGSTYINIHSSVNMGFSGGGTATNVNADIGWGRSAAGMLEINDGNFSGTKGTFRDLKLRDLISTRLICAGTYTVGTLPSAAANAYKFATVSDSSVTTFGSTVSAGGSSKVMVFSNGSNWTVFAI